MTASLVDIKDRTPNPETVGLLEQLLEAAKAGEVRSFAGVVQWDDCGVGTRWSLDPRNSRRMMLAELTLLQHEFLINIGLGENDSILSCALNSMGE